jgi:hypothetical protein
VGAYIDDLRLRVQSEPMPVEGEVNDALTWLNAHRAIVTDASLLLSNISLRWPLGNDQLGALSHSPSVRVLFRVIC